MKGAADRSLIEKLQRQIQSLEGNAKRMEHAPVPIGLGPAEAAFPQNVFPRSAVHEFLSGSNPAAASTIGFISVLLSKLMHREQSCIWISTRRIVYPPGLVAYGMKPETILFVEVKTAKEALWCMEEALKCPAIGVMVGEIGELGFNESRRLQLAVEKSQVTALIHAYQTKTKGPVACASRWRVTPLPSAIAGNLPGLGIPRWKLELLKVKGGRPAVWEVKCLPDGLQWIDSQNRSLSYPSAEREIA